MRKRIIKTTAAALTGTMLLSAVCTPVSVMAQGGDMNQQEGIHEFMDCFLPMPVLSPEGLSEDCWGAPEVGPRDPYNGLEDSDMSDYSYWDGGILKDEATGKYYMFASRWDQRGGHEGETVDGVWYPGWKGSQAVYAVSDNLYGPYEDQGLLWPDYYDGAGHNVFPFEISQNDPLYAEGYRYAIILGDCGEVSGTLHVSRTLENGGEWEHLGQMSTDGDFVLTNISIIVRPDGTYEAINRHGDIATVSSLSDCWHVESNDLWWNLPGLDTSFDDMEDPVLWYSDGLYHCIVNKWDKKQAYYMTSYDGLTNWTLHQGAAYTPHENFLSYEDGTQNNWTKLERPNVYIEDGELKAMLLSVINVEKTDDRANDQNGSKIIVTPFDGAALKEFAQRNDQGILPSGDTAAQTWQNERYFNYGGMKYLQVQGVEGSTGLGEEGNSGWWWPEDWDYDCKIGFLKYDLSQFEGNEEDRVIENASLTLTYLGNGSADADTDSLRVVLCDPDWVEGTGEETDTPEEDLACLNLPKLYYDPENLEETSAVSEEFAINEGLKTVKVDVTELVQQYKKENPDAQYISFAFNETQSGNRLQFGTKEAGDGYGARLMIQYGEEIQEPSEVSDKSSLDLAVKMAEKLEAQQQEHNCYTTESWEAVQAALEAARAVMEDTQATQEQADEAFLELITACNLLENSVQKTGLKAAIDGAEAILAEEESLLQYTPESVEAVRTALEEARRVFAEESADQGSVNQAARALMDAVTSLLVEQEDSRLSILIRKAEEILEAEDQYTQASIAALKEALNAAKETEGNPAASEEEKMQAYNNLAKAMTELVRKAEKSELKTALDKAEEILAAKDQYVEETVSGLEAVTAEAKAVYEKEDASAEEIGEAVKNLVGEILKARRLGDVDANGSVDSGDSARVLKYAAECGQLNELEQKAADVNRDKNADSSDAAKILQYASEKIKTF